APPDVRSIAAAPNGTLFVNVHVGGVVRSHDGGETWTPTIDVDADVHQVIVEPRSGVALVAAAVGHAVSADGGDTWDVDTEGLHGTYSRAIAVAGENLLLTASEGPFTHEAALYRRPLASREPFARVTRGLPEWFAHNIDSHWVAAHGEVAALATEEGDVYRSADAGASWTRVASGLPQPHAVVVS
ncbi:MAG: WD40/YVTN/BNR-like repeat-containing protein, partial [Acidimicrobiia bacterium]